MLARQNFGGRHERGLSAVLYGYEHCGSGAHGLAASNVTDHNSAHGRVFCHIVRDLVNRSLLRPCQFIRQGGNKAGDVPIGARGGVHGLLSSLRHCRAE